MKLKSQGFYCVHAQNIVQLKKIKQFITCGVSHLINITTEILQDHFVKSVKEK